jgi:hypothetical protein
MTPVPAATGRFRRVPAWLAVLAFVAAIAGWAPGAAAGNPATGPFGLTPTTTPSGQPRPYVKLAIAPGRSASDSVIVSNESARRERLRVVASEGITAANSGSAFLDTTGACAGAGCWLSLRPTVVILAAGARRILPFTVTVPRRTRPGQYLAGITVTPARPPHAVLIGSRGRRSARAIIIDQVTVGVAITIGRLARLRSGLKLSAVAALWIGTTPRLEIPVRNVGQTFLRATGRVTCRPDSRRRSYRVIMETVLPGGTAVLAVNAPGLRSGPARCMVRLHDGSRLSVAWSGVVNVPSQTPTRTFHPARSVYVSLPENTVPPWAVALIVIGTLLLAGVLALLMLRRRDSAPTLGGRH